jgi:hypothetical protein
MKQFGILLHGYVGQRLPLKRFDLDETKFTRLSGLQLPVEHPIYLNKTNSSYHTEKDIIYNSIVNLRQLVGWGTALDLSR